MKLTEQETKLVEWWRGVKALKENDLLGTIIRTMKINSRINTPVEKAINELEKLKEIL